jgi:hypothetical protein
MKKRNCTICTLFFPTHVQEHRNDLIYRHQVHHEDVHKNSQVLCNSMTLRSKHCCLFLTATFKTDKSSEWGIGPLVDGTAGNCLFLSLRLAHRNVASKGYFGKISVLYVMLYLHTTQVPVLHTLRFTHAVGHTECPA